VRIQGSKGGYQKKVKVTREVLQGPEGVVVPGRWERSVRGRQQRNGIAG